MCALAVVVIVGACSSSSHSSSSPTTGGSSSPTSSNQSTPAQPTGTPIKVGLITELSGDLAQPWVGQAAKIGAAAVNAAGGIDGHPVSMDICDNQSTQQGAGVCAQKLLVQDKVLLLSGDDAVLEAPVLPVLATAKTIDWSTLAACNECLTTNPNTFVLQPLFVQYFLVPQMIPAADTKVAYFIADNAVSINAAKQASAYYPKAGKQVKLVTVPLSATDFSTPCLQAKADGAQAGVLAINPNQEATLIQTCDTLGLTHMTWVLATATITPQALQTISSLHLQSVVASSYSPQVYSQFDADAAKYGAQVGGITNTLADDAVDPWMGVKLLYKLVQGGGNTGASIKTWLDQQTAFNTNGYTPPINFTATPVPPLLRVKNVSVYEQTWNNGQLVPLRSTPFEFTP
jgi:ABC-type branched-subunit amino acid transport system substrate-binding protein